MPEHSPALTPPPQSCTRPARPGVTAAHEPIEREPRAVRPPYGEPDARLASIDAAHGTEAWRTAARLDRVAALREPLHGLTVTEYEHRELESLAAEDTATVAVLAALLYRARSAEPLPDVR